MTESTIEILRRLDFYSALAVEAIALERLRHIEEEGWSPEHDDAHDKGELSGAAACYVLNSLSIGAPRLKDAVVRMVRELWPWADAWWKPKTPQRDLTRAAALIVADIARRTRAAEMRSLQKVSGT